MPPLPLSEDTHDALARERIAAQHRRRLQTIGLAMVELLRELEALDVAAVPVDQRAGLMNGLLKVRALVNHKSLLLEHAVRCASWRIGAPGEYASSTLPFPVPAPTGAQAAVSPHEAGSQP